MQPFIFLSRAKDEAVMEHNSKIKYKRAILKFSGEVLKDKSTGDVFSKKIICDLASEVKTLHDGGIELGIVIGGGNIFRGAVVTENDFGSDRVRMDNIGMLATVINSLAIADVFEKYGIPVEVFSAMPIPSICTPYSPRIAKQSIANGNVLLLSGGTGSAFFSTDSAAALRANELRADVVIKATKVDGVYDKDPKKFSDARKLQKVSFSDVLTNRLHVMDATAFSLCMDNNIPIVVVDAETDMSNIRRALCGENVGTVINNF